MSILNKSMVVSREQAVVEIMAFYDRVHASRSDKHRPLRVVMPAAVSQSEAAIVAAIEWACTEGACGHAKLGLPCKNIRLLLMHLTKTYDIPDGKKVNFQNPFLSLHDRDMYLGSEPGVPPVLSAMECSFREVGARYARLRPHAIVTQATARVKYVNDEPCVSLGGSADYVLKLIRETAAMLFVQRNDNQPWINGNEIPLARIDGQVRHDSALYQAPAPPKRSKQNDAVNEMIALNVVKTLIEVNKEKGGKGLVLQLGVGALPNLILEMILKTAPKGLIRGIRSEVIINAMRFLPSGIPITGTLLLGDQELVNWADDNPFVSLIGVEETNSPILAEQHDVVSINQVMAVTPRGGCTANVGRRYSGVGGGADFGNWPGITRIVVLAAAAYDRDGKPKRNNIAVWPGRGDIVSVVDAFMPDYIITNLGVFCTQPGVDDEWEFYGTEEEVAEGLITIAEPCFEDTIREVIETGKLSPESRTIPPVNARVLVA